MMTQLLQTPVPFLSLFIKKNKNKETRGTYIHGVLEIVKMEFPEATVINMQSCLQCRFFFILLYLVTLLTSRLCNTAVLCSTESG